MIYHIIDFENFHKLSKYLPQRRGINVFQKEVKILSIGDLTKNMYKLLKKPACIMNLSLNGSLLCGGKFS